MLATDDGVVLVFEPIVCFFRVLLCVCVLAIFGRLIVVMMVVIGDVGVYF